VSGLALYPNGDVVVSGLAAGAPVDTIYGLRGSSSGPSVRWSWGNNAQNGATNDQPLGDLNDVPAVGAGDSSTALVYGVARDSANTYGTVVALAPGASSVAVKWIARGLDPLGTAPLIVPGATVPKTGGGTRTTELVVAASSKSSTVYGVYPGDTLPASVNFTATAANADSSSPPIFANGDVVWGDDTSGQRSALGTGSFGSLTAFAANKGPFWAPLTDGSSVFLARNGNKDLFALDGSWAQSTVQSYSSNINRSQIIDQSAVHAGTNALLVPLSNRILEEQPTNGSAPTGIFTAPGTANPKTPLQGPSGRYYIPITGGVFAVLATPSGTPEWGFAFSGTTITNSSQLDCAGYLYVGVQPNLVYAFLADDQGLANSGWPNYRRDSRNTGNAGATAYGVNSGTCAQ
jgi:hypothetical protein